MHCYARMEHPERCLKVSRESDLKVTLMAGEESTSLVLFTVNDEACRNSQLQCELVSEAGSGEATPSNNYCALKRVKAGQYEMSYLPILPGKYKLHIKIKGELIQGSPFNVTVVKKFNGVPIKVISGVKAPQGIVFNHRGDMIVAEYKEHCISIFNPSGESITSFGSKGSGPKQFNHPCAMAVDDNGNILVADGKNHRIQKFTPEGDYITEVGKRGTNSLEFDFPVGIGIHPRTKMIYVTENKNHCIQILYPNLTYFESITSDDQFNEPKDVAFDSTGNVYVVDNEIQVFTVEGNLMTKFGKEGKEEGQLSYPSGITIDCNDVLHVTELYNYHVSQFTSEGVHLASFGIKGGEPGQFIDPRGIAVGKNGSLYVSDHGNDRIQVFQ